MTTKPYLDTRSSKGPNYAYPVKIAINCKGSSAYIPTGISVMPSQWDATTSKVVAHPLKVGYNIAIQEKQLSINNAINALKKSGVLHKKSLSEIRKMVIDYLNPQKDDEEPLFMERFVKFKEGKKKYGTRITYEQTEKKIRAYDPDADSLTFLEITRVWLKGFDAFMKETAPSANARSIHLRNIRTVFNDAIDDGVTSAPYPFRKFKIESESTKDRSLSVVELKKFLNEPCSPSQMEYRDMFELSFLLCGINIADLARVEKLTNGRVEILRAKTGQPLSNPVCKRAMSIINKYKGEKHLLSFADRYANYRDYLHRLNANLKSIGKNYNRHTKKWEGRSLQPDISFYYARYTWATIAAEIGIPERTIGAALGHSTKGSVTAIYTRVDMRKKIDEAVKKVNEKVYD